MLYRTAKQALTCSIRKKPLFSSSATTRYTLERTRTRTRATVRADRLYPSPPTPAPPPPPACSADAVLAVSAAIAVRFDVVLPLCQLADAAAAAFDAADIAAFDAEEQAVRDEEWALHNT